MKIIVILLIILQINKFNANLVTKFKKSIIRHSTIDTQTNDDTVSDIHNIFACEATAAYKIHTFKVLKSNNFKCTDKTILIEFEIKKIDGNAKGSGYLMPNGGCLASQPISYQKDHCQKLKT